MAYSDIQTIEKSVEKVRFHKEPAVLPPLSEWEKIEELLEDLEMSQSSLYIKAIAGARTQIKQKKFYELDLRTGKFKVFKR